MRVLGPDGNVLDLRTKLGEGGEGAVWASPVSPTLAIKTYLKPMPPLQAEKLRAMASVADAQLLSAAAWPKRVVYDSSNVPIGFEMPKLSGQRPLHDIFGRTTRSKALPGANWQMLVHAAYNLSCAFESFHARNIVVGDVNSNNVVIQPDARVIFIDCDSFQIRTPTRVYRCDVGVPEYQPAELQTTAFSSIDRLPAHDNFGMAVMIFQLLFVGKHPFMGRLPNPGTAAPTIGENIANGNYFYDDRAKSAGLQPPPASLSIVAVGPEVAKLFERAFRGRPPERPSPREWQLALKNLEQSIVPCPVTTAHRYLKGMQCPWCAIEVHSKIVYFTAPTLFTSTGEIDESIWTTLSNDEVNNIWAEIAKVQPPNVIFTPVIARSAKVVPISQDIKERGRQFLGAIGAICIVGMILFLVPILRHYAFYDIGVLLVAWLLGRPSGGAELVERRNRLASARSAYEVANNAWRDLCDSTSFRDEINRLSQVRDAARQQRPLMDAEIAAATKDGERKAREQHLNAHLIEKAKIKGIGRALTARLAAWNIETALDIGNAVYSVNGIGEAKAQALFAWRRDVERSFRFELRMLDPLIRDIRAKYARERLQARNSLMQAPAALRRLVAMTEGNAPEVYAKAVQTRAALDQAEANLRPFTPLIYR